MIECNFGNGQARTFAQAIDGFFNFVAGLAVRLAWVAVDVGVGDHLDRLGNMIEQHHRAVQAEREVGYFAIVVGAFAELFVISHHVVPREANQPARETRQLRQVHLLVRLEHAIQLRQRIVGGDFLLRTVWPADRNSVAGGCEGRFRVGRHERMRSDPLAANHAFQQKRVPGRVGVVGHCQTFVRHHRRQRVGQQLAINGNCIALLGKDQELIECRMVMFHG